MTRLNKEKKQRQLTEANAEIKGDSLFAGHEDRQILTPFAFKIDESLFGIPLAKPWKRAAALLVDVLLISMLSEMPGELLALVVAITLFQLGSKTRAQQQGKVKGKKRRFMMRIVSAFIVFITLTSYLPDFIDELSGRKADKTSTEVNDEVSSEHTMSPTDAIVLSAVSMAVSNTINTSDCNTSDCWYDVLRADMNAAQDIALDSKTKQELITSAVDELSLPKQDQVQLAERLFSTLAQGKQEKAKTESSTSTKEEKPKQENSQPVNAFFKFIEGIIDDLGVGFGWAAFYFTAFTALWRGQTPGKKIFSIQVLQLDGTPLSIIDSFGRYGGYGAGIATGLLGFAQIFWDPNRQAIHDKISATVVINNKT